MEATSQGPATLPFTESWALESASGKDYVVQIGYPRDWAAREPKAGEEPESVPVVYLTDGNSVFLTALEAVHRWLSIRPPGSNDSAVVVTIDYPLETNSPALFSGRRGWDLTPPAAGLPDTQGGGDEFLDFITAKVMPLVERRLKETRNAVVGTRALCGHSYGGLFALHTLFTRTDLFSSYLISSPSVWWHEKAIIKEEESFFASDRQTALKPSVVLSVGGLEQGRARRRGETEERYELMSKMLRDARMIDNTLELYQRLESSDKLDKVVLHEYNGEDHMTIIPCAISRGITTFLEEWQFLE